MLYTNRSRARKLALWPLAMMACWPATALRAGTAECNGTHTAVRSTDRMVTELVGEGYARSATFRRLVDGISATNALVYVEPGSCAYGHLNACLVAFIAATSRGRYLRIILTRPYLLDRNRLIALVGHELQHALEVAERSDVVDVEGMIEMYRRIGFPMKDRFGYRQGYETSAARAAGDAVFDELTAPPTSEFPSATFVPPRVGPANRPRTHGNTKGLVSGGS